MSRAGYILKLLNERDDSYFMLNYKDTQQDIEKLKVWLDGLNVSTGRAPKGMKKYFDRLTRTARLVTALVHKLQGKADPKSDISFVGADFLYQQIRNDLAWLKPEDIDLINAKMGKKAGETDTLKIDNVTYINKSIMGFATFKRRSGEIAKHLKTLKGYHAIPLKKDLTIWFVKKELSKAAAKYKSDKDVIYVRPDKMGKVTDGYGSVTYVITHELAHRVEYLFRHSLPSIDFTDSQWATTKYSQTTGSFETGGEHFAELFALSHWSKKYPEYRDTIDRFIRTWK